MKLNNPMAEIFPAIIPESLSDLEEKLSFVKGLAKTVHIDVSDGKFSSNLTFPLKPDDREDFERIKNEEEGMPFWEEFDFEVHLMVEHPEKHIGDWLSAGASRLVIHVETVKDFGALKKEVGTLTDFSLALLFETPLETIEPFISEIESVQLMSIGKIGYHGEHLDEKIFDRISVLRKKFPNLTISVDGGVTLENAEQLLDVGASRLVVGSALFNTVDIVDTIKQFQSL